MRQVKSKKSWKKHIIIIFTLMIFSCFWWQVTQVKTMTVMAGVSQKVILLDSGHGGWDPGKVSATGTLEKDINLEITKYLQSYLEEGGATVLLSRAEDEALGQSKRDDMKERINIAQEGEAELIISIHQNAFPQEKVKGAQVFYYKTSQEGKGLAEAVQNRLIVELDNGNHRQAKANADYYILKTDDTTAIIVECGFLSNKEEEELLKNSEYEKKIAWAIYLGIVDYYNSMV